MFLINSARQLPKAINIVGNGTRYMSSSGKLSTLEVNDKTGVATFTMNRPPVNGLNYELLTEFNETLDQLEKDKSRGLIITSASKSVFSGGLDIMEMYKPNPERFKNFWTALQDMWIKLYGCSFPTAAAINGHSPAGGCLIALCCEYRVMLPNYTIGLNETQLGIVAPKWFHTSMKHVLSSRVAESALTLGLLFKTEDALKIGLIDEIAEDKATAIQRCEAFLSQFQKVSPQARALTKQIIRSPDIQDLEQNRQQDFQMVEMLINQPKIQKGLELYLASLKTKKN